jgi:ArsR family transcriptional regulator
MLKPDRSLPLLDAACCAPLTDEALTAEQAAPLAAMFKAIGDPVRLRLLSMIASCSGGEVCVCDLSEAFDVTGPTISHHLRVLREAGLIDCERRGTWVYYWLVPGVLGRLAGLLDAQGVAGLSAT